MNYLNRNGYSLVKMKYIQKRNVYIHIFEKYIYLSILMALHGETLKTFCC